MSRKSVGSNDPYNLTTLYVAPPPVRHSSTTGLNLVNEIQSAVLKTPSALPLGAITIRSRSKSRSRPSNTNNGLTTVYPDSRGIWPPM